MIQFSKGYLALAVVVLSGCASTSTDTGRVETKQILQNHQASVSGVNIDQARAHWETIDGYEDERVVFGDDLRLPNPELEMIFFPSRDGDGAVSSSYKVKFSMYERVHYKLGN